MRAAALLVLVAACDPIWGAQVKLRDPANRPISDATIAVACEHPQYEDSGHVARTDAQGSGFVGSLGTQFPVGCDVYIAKPGYESRRIRYRDLCPAGAEHCERYFTFDLVLPPAP